MLKEKFVWAGSKADALKWSRKCSVCQHAKIHRHTRLQPNNIDVPDQRFSHIHLDLIVLTAVDQYRYCLTVIDRVSRWPHAIPLQDMRAETVAWAFYNGWIALFDTPLTMTTDQEAQFQSSLFTALARLVGSDKIRTTPYHPQSNGILEGGADVSPERPLDQTTFDGAPRTKDDVQGGPAGVAVGAALRYHAAHSRRILHHARHLSGPVLFCGEAARTLSPHDARPAGASQQG